MDNPAALTGKVIDAYLKSYETISESKEYCDVEDQGFYHIKTNKGDCVIDMRVQHNGYYGGRLEFVDDLEDFFDWIKED